MEAPDRRPFPAPSSDLPKWQNVLLTGLALWIASVVVTGTTGNVYMIPTVVLLGSFLVPVTTVIWYLDHYRDPELTLPLVFYTFIVGGVLGTLAASVLESWLRSDSLLIYVGVGLIEEFAKLMALIFVARRLPHYRIRDGLVLGATVGFGFGALESSGYALTSLFTTGGHGVSLSLGSLVFTELIRGVLAPVGHGLWTAILGGVLFAASRGGGLRFTRKVFGAYLLVALLHTLWDAMRGLAFVLTAVFTATAAQRMAIMEGMLLPPTIKQVKIFLAIEVGGLALISLIGLLLLWRLWHAADPRPTQRGESS
jgi:RsiW-degrading membrane proteinase PrsW (M82 family)